MTIAKIPVIMQIMKGVNMAELELVKFFLPRMFKELREALGLSQEELASKVGLSRQSLSYMETGSSSPSLETALRWLDSVTKQIRKGVKGSEQG